MLEVFTVKNEEEKEQVMKYINETTQKIYDAELKYVMSNLENDLQKVIYLDWWYSGHLWKNGERMEKYKHVNNHDWDMAYGFIMETISKGMG